jgi:hypothetical protein
MNHPMTAEDLASPVSVQLVLMLKHWPQILIF